MTLLLYENIPINECGEELVNLEAYDFVLEPAYYEQKLSSDARMFLRKSVAQKLTQIQKELRIYKIKIWDGFRPRSVQKTIYEKFWRELSAEHPDWSEDKLKMEVGKFVSIPDNPKRVPPHASGGAVDLTLTDMEGKELDMGTGFDYFGPEAAALYFEEGGENEIVKNNRKILREAMLGAGFSGDENEWWHFDYGNQKWAAELGKSEAMYGEVVAISA